MVEDRFIRAGEVQQLTGLNRVTVWRMEKRGEFPKRRKLTVKAVGWSLAEILRWMESREQVAA